MKRVTTSLPLNLVAHRTAHAAAQHAPATGPAPGEWLVQRLTNGVQVACAVTSQSVTPVHLSAVYRAGSRHENHATEAGESGVGHFLRRALGLHTEGATGFATVRSLQQMGASVDCTLSREHLSYQLRLAKAHDLHEAAKFVGHTASANLFLPWELPRVVYPYLRKDVDLLYRHSFDQLLIELLHKAAYRDQPLSHSLYAPNYTLNRGFSEAALTGFQARCLTPSRLTLVATAQDTVFPNAAALLKTVQALAESDAFTSQNHPAQTVDLVTDGKVATKCTVVSGGDARYAMPPLELTLVAVGWEGLPLGHKDEAALAVLMSGLDGGRLHRPRVSWCGTGNGLLAKALASQNTGSPAATIGALSWSYADSGLVGFELVGPNEAVRAALPKALAEVKRVGRDGLTEAELQRAKTAIKMDTLLEVELPGKVVNYVAEELSLTGHHTPVKDVLSRLDAVTREDVKRVAGSLFKEKLVPAMSAVGDIHGLPYLSDLKL